MDCRQFRENHCAYLDDTLAGVELVGMQIHIADCDRCARHDCAVRRSLLVFKNLPRIEPSADFAVNLERRIRQSVLEQAATGRSFRIGGIAAAVVGAAMLGYIMTSLPGSQVAQDIVMPPVIATMPDLDVPAVSAAGPDIVASVSAGLPIWTAALYAEQASQHFARPELVLVSYTR